MPTAFGAVNLLVYGLAMVFAILDLPGGLMGLARRWWPLRLPVQPTAGAQEGMGDVR